MLAEIPPEEVVATLERVAVESLREAGIDRPPIDALELARGLSVRVAWDDRQQGRARYVRLSRPRGRAPQPTILLRPEPRAERQHWAVAHEIGEHVAHRVFAELGVDPREVSPLCREWVANRLAGRLLLPAEWFAADAAACAWDLVALKARYPTASHELIARRMLEMQPEVIISIFDQGSLSWRRSNVPGRAPPPSAAEMACWRLVHRRNRPHRARDGMDSVQGWPVHEEGWKREILRREVQPEADAA